MKKAIRLAAMVFGVAAGLSALAAEEVRSANTHGIVKVETSSTNVLIAVPWTFYTPTGASTTNLPVDHLVWPQNLDDGDLLMLVTQASLQTDAKYETWMLVVDSTSGVGRWVSATTVSEKGDTQSDVKRAIERGLGLWLIRHNPKTAGGAWKPFYLYGQYAAQSASVAVSSASTAANPVMVANPFCQALSVNADVAWSNVGANDTLSIPNGTDAWDLALWDGTQQKWYVSKSVRSGRKVITSKNYDLTIPAGHGFWYVRRTAGDITITFNGKRIS